ncbi:MAG: amidohydrolase family protein, partial [Planctomycetes bacterium]|nr:amidohydrolase family protein [Planctomycetota bacterium]
MRTAGKVAAVLLGGLMVSAFAFGQPETQPASQPASAPATQPESVPTTTTQAVEEKEQFLAVINGRVHTVTGPVLERATVLCKDGVIAAIGTDVHLPVDCEIVDAHGMYVYPGLVAPTARGIHGAKNPQDTSNVYSLSMCVALAGGITTALAGDSVAKLTFGSTEDMILKEDAYVSLDYSTEKPLERAQLRADLEKVRTYLRDLDRFEREKERDKDAKPPEKDWLKGKYEKYLKLLKREAVAVASADTTQPLRDLAELATTYAFDLVIRGAYEGWTTAPALGRAGVSAVVTPRTDRYPDERFNRPTGSSIENARILRDSGVPVAVVPASPSIGFSGLAGRDLLHLNMEAAFAVRGGMSNDDALETITIDAARVLGVDDRVGSLEVGKDADLIVCSGDLLHYMTQVHYTIVNGRVVYDKSKETLFAHIRPEGE